VSATSIFIGNGSENVVATVDIIDGSLEADIFVIISGGTTVNLTGGRLETGGFLELNSGILGFGSGTVDFNQSGGDVISGFDINIGSEFGGNVDYTITGGRVRTANDFVIRGVSLIELNDGEVNVGNELSLGSGGSVIDQSGGTLIVGASFVNDQGGEYIFTGGVLTRATAGVLEYSGDFEFSDNATLQLDNDKTVSISGSFLSIDVDDTLFSGGGVLDLSGLLIPQDPNLVGFIPLLTIGDNLNLLDFDALDQIAIIGLIAGINQRLTEADFQFGIGDAAGFALVEGTAFGNESTIGIAFSNVFAVPEPSTFSLGLIASLMLFRRKKRAN